MTDLTKAGTPRKRAPGAGRPKGDRQLFKPTIYLEQKHLTLIAQWQHEHNCSASEAVRQMIERAGR